MLYLSFIRQPLFLYALCVFSHPQGALYGASATQQRCATAFQWDFHTKSTCTSSDGKTRHCDPASCKFANQQLTESSFVFRQCAFQEGGGPEHPADVMVEWFRNNHTDQAYYPLDVFGTSGSNTLRWTCPFQPGLNDHRPICGSCWP